MLGERTNFGTAGPVLLGRRYRAALVGPGYKAAGSVMEDLAGVFATAGRGAARRASRLPLRAEQFIDSTGHCFRFAIKSNSRGDASRRPGQLRAPQGG